MRVEAMQPVGVSPARVFYIDLSKCWAPRVWLSAAGISFLLEDEVTRSLWWDGI